MTSRRVPRLPHLCLLLLALTLGGCSGCDDGAGDSSDPSTPVGRELPKLELKADSKDLLLTYVDTKGDFHVVEKVDQVPEDRRDQVRVVVTTRVDGTGELLYVADLRKAESDGTYPVTTMTRAQWDEVGAKRRQARLEALVPSAAPPKPPTPGDPPPAADGQVRAIIYGADWCKPCHQAKRYLKSRGVAVVEKDIEESSVARREMQQKLAKINRAGASIPVIDINGQVLVGFSTAACDRAIRAARNSKTL